MKKNLNELIINPINPRKITPANKKRLQQSIMLFPKMLYARDIVINEKNVVLAGNQRTSILKEITNTSPIDWMVTLQENEKWLDFKETEKEKVLEYWKKWVEHPIVDVTLITDMTEEEEKELIIKDNNEFGEFDYTKLQQIYNEVNLVNFGFDEQLFYSVDDDDTIVKANSMGTRGKKISVLSFGKNTVAVTPEEYEELCLRYDDYVNNVGVDFGFIKSLFTIKLHENENNQN